MAEQTLSETDVTFKMLAGGPLVATVYRPPGAAIAAVVDVHGGAWTSGDRTMNAAIARHLAASSIAVLSLDFRMPPAAAYPEMMTDVAAGIRWLKSHAADVGTDAARVGLLGTSSGGHLALLAALRPDDVRYSGPTEDGQSGIGVPFVVACWPVSDPLARYQMVRQRANARLIEAHHAFWSDEAAMAEGSPFAIVTRGDAQQMPPVLIVQGTNDDNLTPDMQQRFIAAYQARGGSAELAVFQEQVHGFIGRDPAHPSSLDALERIVAFIRREAGVAESR
jgi:acetyl esterase